MFLAKISKLEKWKSLLSSNRPKFEICGSTLCVFLQQEKGTNGLYMHGSDHEACRRSCDVWGCFAGDTVGDLLIYPFFLSQPLSPPNCHYSFPMTLFLNPLRKVSALHRHSAQRCCAGGRCALVCVSVISLTAAR